MQLFVCKGMKHVKKKEEKRIEMRKNSKGDSHFAPFLKAKRSKKMENNVCSIWIIIIIFFFLKR